MKKKYKYFLVLVLAFFSVGSGAAQTPAFPGAEGGGMYTTGGRGGKVYYVNSLDDDKKGDKATQEGTLRWCLDREGPKTILFKVAGIIRLKSQMFISENTTIAGQSAPGNGICIADNAVKIKGDNVIVRYLRFRMGDLNKVEDDSFGGHGYKNIIVDHCSMSWGTDECGSFYDNENFTLQWCILSESLTSSVHRKGSHGYGGIWGGRNASFHHNLLADHNSRNPRMCGSRYSAMPEFELVDFRNNVIYNWGENSGYAAEGGKYNLVNNYYKPTGYSTNKSRIFSPNADDGKNKQPAGVWGKFYVLGNYVDGNEKVTQDNRLGIQPNPKTKPLDELLTDTLFCFLPVKTHCAQDAYALVLKKAGASYRRDNTDKRIVEEVNAGKASNKKKSIASDNPGFIDSQNDVGAWDTYSYSAKDVLDDKNLDGIPDKWMKKHFSKKNANDLNDDGYTYLEVYLNSLVSSIMK